MTNSELKTALETLRDKCLEPDCIYNDKQSKALGLMMDAIDALHEEVIL